MIVPAIALALAALSAPAAATQEVPPKEADYVIIGGGTAGCALAARLCEGLPDATVVLLERGNPRNRTEELLVRSLRPAFDVWETPSLTETWDSLPNPGLTGLTMTMRTGNTLGGTSAINGAHWTRPTAANAASWGVKGLDAATADRLYDVAAKQIGIAVAPDELQQAYVNEWLEAAAKAGINVIPEDAPLPKGGERDVAFKHRLTADEGGRRIDSYRGYLEAVVAEGGKCESLVVVQSATVKRIVLEDGVATGVEWSKGDSDETMTLAVNEQVVSSAGPFGSPKLLQLSGVGPKDVLADAGIDQVTELPVGVDSIARPFSFQVHTFQGRPVPREAVGFFEDWKADEDCFLAGEGCSVLGTSLSQIDGVLADEDSIITSATAHPPADEGERRMLSGCFPNPTAPGYIRVNASDPEGNPPTVSPNLLGNEADIQSALGCMQRQAKVIDAFPDAWNLTLFYPPEGVTTNETLLRSVSQTGNHYVGGAEVGLVLAPDLKVKGYSNLRVVDASALPLSALENAGPMSSVYMLAEHAAELMLAEAGVPGNSETPGGYGERRLASNAPMTGTDSQQAAPDSSKTEEVVADMNSSGGLGASMLCAAAIALFAKVAALV